MATDAKKDTAVKAERKKPVRKAPVQKDYPNKLAWLAALVEYETAATEVTNKAKVERLNKRIASAQATADEATAKVAALTAERDALTGDEATDADGLTDEDHLVLEGKA